MIYQRSYFSDLANSGKAFRRLPQPLAGPPRELQLPLPPGPASLDAGGERPACSRSLAAEPPTQPLGAASPLRAGPLPCPVPPRPRVALRLARGQRCDRGRTAARPALRSGGARNAAEPPMPCAALPCPAVPPQRGCRYGPGCPCAHGRAQLG